MEKEKTERQIIRSLRRKRSSDEFLSADKNGKKARLALKSQGIPVKMTSGLGGGSPSHDPRRAPVAVRWSTIYARTDLDID